MVDKLHLSLNLQSILFLIILDDVSCLPFGIRIQIFTLENSFTKV